MYIRFWPTLSITREHIHFIHLLPQSSSSHYCTSLCLYDCTYMSTLVSPSRLLVASSKTHKHTYVCTHTQITVHYLCKDSLSFSTLPKLTNTHTRTHTHTYVCVPINYCPLPVQRQSVLQHLCSAHSLQNTTFPHNNSTLLHLTDTHKAHKHSNTGSHHNCSGTPMRRRYCYHQSQHQLLCISQGVGP